MRRILVKMEISNTMTKKNEIPNEIKRLSMFFPDENIILPSGLVCEIIKVEDEIRKVVMPQVLTLLTLRVISDGPSKGHVVIQSYLDDAEVTCVLPPRLYRLQRWWRLTKQRLRRT